MQSESNQERYNRIHAVRKKAKVVTYSAMYGVGSAKLARETGTTRKQAQALLDAFWGINWAVTKIAASAEKKELFGTMWVRNPVSCFWQQLRTERDVWSTLNQSTGVYCFDTWVGFCMEGGMKLTASFHDEVVAGCVVKGDLDMVLKVAMDKANEKLKLNVKLGHDTQYGKNYAEIH